MILDTAREILGKVAADIGCACERTYVHVGQVAWDGCDQLVLSVVGFRPGTPGNLVTPDIVCGPVTVLAVVSRVWCVPVGDGKRPPTVDELDFSGWTSVDEADRLWDACAAALADTGCRGGRVTGANAVGPEGGLVGWSVNIEWTR